MSNGNEIKDQTYFLGEIRTVLHRDFTPSESAALKILLDKIVRPPSPKIIDLNIPFWLLFKLYLQIYFGEDKRNKSRQERDNFEKEKLKEYKDRDALYYFKLLPEEIGCAWNYEQKRQIMSVFQRAIKIPTRKILETNLRFKLKKRYYLTIYLGFDRRAKRRTSKNGLMNKLSFAGTISVYAIVILFVAFFAKTVLNYDIIPGRHGIDWLIEKSGILK